MKAIKFIKENKVIMFALCVVLLSFVFLALPGQFAHYGPLNLSSKVASERFKYFYNGYQWMFATKEDILGNQIGKPVAQGIAAFVMLILCVPGLLFSKKSSFVSLLTSLALITVSILYFTISAAGFKCYTGFDFMQPEDHAYYLILWVPYLIASFLIIAGLLMGYRTFLVMKSEIKSPSQSKGTTYSYLKK